MQEIETLKKIRVRPFNNVELSKLISRAVGVVNGKVEIMSQESYFYAENIPFSIEKPANEHVYSQQLMDTMAMIFVEGQVDFCYMVPCQIVLNGKEKNPNEITFYFPLAHRYFEVYSDEEIGLKEYFGDKYFDNLETEIALLHAGTHLKVDKTIN